MEIIHLLGQDGSGPQQQIYRLFFAIAKIRQAMFTRLGRHSLGQFPDGAGGQIEEGAAQAAIERKRLQSTFIGGGEDIFPFLISDWRLTIGDWDDTLIVNPESKIANRLMNLPSSSMPAAPQMGQRQRARVPA